MKPYPYDRSGITRDAQGVARYDALEPSLVHLIGNAVQRWPGETALIELGGDAVTYAEMWERAGRVAGGLVADGVAPGDRVAVLLPNGVEWVYAFFGVLLAGAVVVPVNTRFAPPEIEYVITDSGARVVIDTPGALPDGEPPDLARPGNGDLAAIFYTSGTTGFPKGAMTTHENFLSNVETFYRVAKMSPEERIGMRTLVSVPLFHVTGCNSQTLPILAGGGTVVIMPTPDLKIFLQTITELDIRMLISVPAIYFHALASPDAANADLTRVGWVCYGGAPVAPSLVRRMREAFPTARLGNGFGLTEVASIATFLPHEDAIEYADSVGFAAPVVDLRVKDPDPDTGVGELLIRGPNTVAGYWNKPEATAETFVDGWMHSGDLARIDDDGYVYLVDRAKDMINRGGENVYCVEVENALAGAPGVLEAAVIGVPDDMMGEKVGAVIVIGAGEELDVPAVNAYLRPLLADFKIPQFWEARTDPLPRNPGGKVLKPVLREGFAGTEHSRGA